MFPVPYPIIPPMLPEPLCAYISILFIVMSSKYAPLPVPCNIPTLPEYYIHFNCIYIYIIHFKIISTST
jgi:hypothetical protein